MSTTTGTQQTLQGSLTDSSGGVHPVTLTIGAAAVTTPPPPPPPAVTLSKDGATAADFVTVLTTADGAQWKLAAGTASQGNVVSVMPT